MTGQRLLLLARRGGGEVRRERGREGVGPAAGAQRIIKLFVATSKFVPAPNLNPHATCSDPNLFMGTREMREIITKSPQRCRFGIACSAIM